MPRKPVFTVSAKAAEKIQDFMVQNGRVNHYVYVALVHTHCMGGKGFAYRFAFQDQVHGWQEAFDENGVSFAVDISNAGRLDGTTIDYAEGLEQQGFVIKNPNAISKCPCGHHDIF